LDLLNYAKEREPDYQLCDPNRPVREIYDLMLPRAKDYGVVLELDLDEDLTEAWFDPEGIHRCLLNLATNAIDACTDIESPQKDSRVVLRSLKGKNHTVVYEVIDNGSGMDNETRSKVFQRFFSTKGSRGTGLGLMIAKKIIDEHDGDLELQTEEKKGTRFVVRLPPKYPHSGISAL
jgi:signal transduction histidine kinase